MCVRNVLPTNMFDIWYLFSVLSTLYYNYQLYSVSTLISQKGQNLKWNYDSRLAWHKNYPNLQFGFKLLMIISNDT